MVANILLADPPPPPPHTPDHGLESKGQTSTISEHDHVAYQIKGNHECSNMVANILPAPPPPPTTLGDEVNRSKNQLFHNMVMLHIKITGIMKRSNMIANILPGWSQKVKPQLFQNMIMLHITLKGVTKFCCRLPPPPPPPIPLILGLGSIFPLFQNMACVYHS